MLPPGGRRVARRPREWAVLALLLAVLFWIAGALLFATRFSTLQHAHVNSASAPKLAADAPPNIQTRKRRRLDSTLHKAKKPLPAPLPTLPPPPVSHIDQRVSNFADPLSPSSLRGGWRFTREVYDHATTQKNKKKENFNATVISWESPRVIHFKNFLSPKEVQHLIKLAESGFHRSEVVSDSQVVSQSRTSYGCWLNGAEKRTDAVYQIQDRIARATGIPEAFSESLYVLRYEQFQKYEAHTDHCRQNTARQEMLTESCRSFLSRAGGPECGSEGGGPTCGDRLATFIIYLKTPERGGETVFPRAVINKNKSPSLSKAAPKAAKAMKDREKADVSDIHLIGGVDTTLGQAESGLENQVETEMKSAAAAARSSANATDTNKSDASEAFLPWYCREESHDKVLKVLPLPGDAIFFFNYVPPSEGDFGYVADALAIPDPTSSHAGCPPIKGTKMIATRWMRSALFG